MIVTSSALRGGSSFPANTRLPQDLMSGLDTQLSQIPIDVDYRDSSPLTGEPEAGNKQVTKYLHPKSRFHKRKQERVEINKKYTGETPDPKTSLTVTTKSHLGSRFDIVEGHVVHAEIKSKPSKRSPMRLFIDLLEGYDAKPRTRSVDNPDELATFVPDLVNWLKAILKK